MHTTHDTVTGNGGKYCIHCGKSRLRRIQIDLIQFGSARLISRWVFFTHGQEKENLDKVSLTLLPASPLFSSLSSFICPGNK